jgi:hypothetical protein
MSSSPSVEPLHPAFKTARRMHEFTSVILAAENITELSMWWRPSELPFIIDLIVGGESVKVFDGETEIGEVVDAWVDAGGNVRARFATTTDISARRVDMVWMPHLVAQGSQTLIERMDMRVCVDL